MNDIMYDSKNDVYTVKGNSTRGILLRSFDELVKSPKDNVRDLGKIMAFAGEIFVSDWFNMNIDKFNVIKEHDDVNESGFDLISDDENEFKIQVKIRSTSLHLEQTRRKSPKSEGKNDTGHVAYTVGESDMFAFVRPTIDTYDDLSSWNIVFIPERELHSKRIKNALHTSILKPVWNKYASFSTKEKIELLENEWKKKMNT